MLDYLKILLVAVLVSISEGCRSEVKKVNTTVYLPPPEPKFLEITDCNIVTVRWDPVDSNPGYPVLGFKIKLWGEKKRVFYKYGEENGSRVLIPDSVATRKSLHVLPSHKPEFEAVLPPDVLETQFRVKLGEEYEIRGLSFNAFGDGPLSSAIGLKINAPEVNEMAKK